MTKFKWNQEPCSLITCSISMSSPLAVWLMWERSQFYNTNIYYSWVYCINWKCAIWSLYVKLCKLKSWSIQMSSLPVCSENLMHFKFTRVSNIVPKSSLGFFWDPLHHKHTIFKTRSELIHLHILLFAVWGSRSVPDFTFIYFLLIFISLLFFWLSFSVCQNNSKPSFGALFYSLSLPAVSFSNLKACLHPKGW